MAAKITRVQMRAILTQLTRAAPGEAEAGIWNGAKVKLFKNEKTPSSGDVLADYTEADFTGYVESTAVTWGTPYVDEVGRAVILGDLKTFAATGSGTTNIIYGYYVVDSAEEVLLYAEKFEEPRDMDETADAIPVIPRVVLNLAA